MCAKATSIKTEADPLLGEEKMDCQYLGFLHKPVSTNTLQASISAIKTASGERRPQAIAHRGYKAAFPENTMGAFRGAAEVGAHAIETDIHLSKDGVVVLSHVGGYLLHLVQN